MTRDMTASLQTVKDSHVRKRIMQQRNNREKEKGSSVLFKPLGWAGGTALGARRNATPHALHAF